MTVVINKTTARLVGGAALCAAMAASTVAQAEGYPISSYQNTNQLVWEPGFRDHVAEFFGDLQGMYFWRAKVSEQMLAGLGGPPDAVVSLPGEVFMASACRAHSCPEKAAYITDGEHELMAMLAYFCPADGGRTDMVDDGCLLVFYRDGESRERLTEHLLSWKADVAEQAQVHYLAVE